MKAKQEAEEQARKEEEEKRKAEFAAKIEQERLKREEITRQLKESREKAIKDVIAAREAIKVGSGVLISPPGVVAPSQTMIPAGLLPAKALVPTAGPTITPLVPMEKAAPPPKGVPMQWVGGKTPPPPPPASQLPATDTVSALRSIFGGAGKAGPGESKADGAMPPQPPAPVTGAVAKAASNPPQALGKAIGGMQGPGPQFQQPPPPTPPPPVSGPNSGSGMMNMPAMPPMGMKGMMGMMGKGGMSGMGMMNMPNMGMMNMPGMSGMPGSGPSGGPNAQGGKGMPNVPYTKGKSGPGDGPVTGFLSSQPNFKAGPEGQQPPAFKAGQMGGPVPGMGQMPQGMAAWMASSPPGGKGGPNVPAFKAPPQASS